MRTARSLPSLGGAALALLAIVAACHLTPKAPPLLAAATAPQFAVESTLGPQSSQAALARGPLLLVFYRGHW